MPVFLYRNLLSEESQETDRFVAHKLGPCEKVNSFGEGTHSHPWHTPLSSLTANEKVFVLIYFTLPVHE